MIKNNAVNTLNINLNNLDFIYSESFGKVEPQKFIKSKKKSANMNK